METFSPIRNVKTRSDHISGSNKTDLGVIGKEVNFRFGYLISSRKHQVQGSAKIVKD